MATQAGAIAIHRDEDLCGDVPDIPVYLHALSRMGLVKGVVAVHANNPTVDKNLIAMVKKNIEMGVGEVMTSRPVTHMETYHRQNSEIYGSIRGLSTERLLEYGDPYKPNPDVLIVDTSIEIETPESFDLCQKQSVL